MSMVLKSRGFVLYITETMIRKTNLVNLFSRFVHFHERCRPLASAMSTSHTYRDRYSRNSTDIKINNARGKYEDTFGDIESFEQMFQRIKEDPEDILEYQREKAALGKTVSQYIKEVKSHLDRHDYKSALKVLEVDMVNDRKRLVPFIYKVLISYNAQIGNLKEAYRLYTNFKKRQGIVTGAMYTSLFNACANCKNSLLAVQKAKAVEENMRSNKNHSINTSNYNVMLKAYGRHGDIPSCLKIMDEVIERRDKVRAETYNFLLQACLSDRNSGLRHALVVWRKMIQNLVKPDIYSFNLLLKCVNDCSLGDALLIPGVIEDIKKESGKFFSRKVVFKNIGGEKQRTVLKIPASEQRLSGFIGNSTTESQEKNKKDVIELQNIETSQLLLEEKPETLEIHKQVIPSVMKDLENQSTDLDMNKNENVLCESKQNDSSESPQKTEDYISLQSFESNKTQLGLGEKLGTSEIQKEVSQSEVNNLENQLTDLDMNKNENTLCESQQIISSVEVPSSEEPEECKSVPDITSLSESELPNLIALKPTTGSVVEFGVLTKPHHRFMLLGGIKGFLKTMKDFKAEPNIKTFTMLVNVIPPTVEAEQELISTAEAHKIKLDTTFFNMLIRKRIFRDEDSLIKDCLEQMHSLGLKPDLLTFGIMAIACRTREQGVDLIATLRNYGYRVNTEILETLLKKAEFARDMNYVLTILRAAKEDGAEVSQRFVAKLSRIIRAEKSQRKRDEENELKEIEEASTSLPSS